MRKWVLFSNRIRISMRAKKATKINKAEKENSSCKKAHTNKTLNSCNLWIQCTFDNCVNWQPKSLMLANRLWWLSSCSCKKNHHQNMFKIHRHQKHFCTQFRVRFVGEESSRITWTNRHNLYRNVGGLCSHNFYPEKGKRSQYFA